MTREMVKEYGVDYQAQFGLCVSYLLENKEEKEVLKGTENQVKFANDIMKDIEELLERASQYVGKYGTEKKNMRFKRHYNKIISYLDQYELAKDVIEDFKDVVYEEEASRKLKMLCEIFESKENMSMSLISATMPCEFFR